MIFFLSSLSLTFSLPFSLLHDPDLYLPSLSSLIRPLSLRRVTPDPICLGNTVERTNFTPRPPLPFDLPFEEEEVRFCWVSFYSNPDLLTHTEDEDTAAQVASSSPISDEDDEQ